MDVTDASMIAVSTVDAYNAASTGDWAGAAGDVALALAGAAAKGQQAVASPGWPRTTARHQAGEDLADSWGCSLGEAPVRMLQ
jgi:hypothetical protein